MHIHNALRLNRTRVLARPRMHNSSAVTFSVASRNAAQEQLRGGDVFDALIRPDSWTCFLVADLSSKGSLGIAHAEQVSLAFRNAAWLSMSPSQILSELNVLRFASRTASGSVDFASAFVVIFDPSATDVRYASAGHGPALLVEGRSHRHLVPSGPLLGIVEDATFEESSISLSADALLVVATDGFSECRNVAMDSMQFGTAGIVRALAFDDIRSSRSAAEIIARGADTFSGRIYREDATVAVMKRRYGRFGASGA